MPKIDLSVIGKKTAPAVFEYTWKDVVLYALGVGASAEDLSFVYENAPGGLKVLPSFCVVPAIRAFPNCGPNIQWPLMIHGEMEIRLSESLPLSGKIIQVGEVTDIFDKGKGAVFHIKITGKREDGAHLFDAFWDIFYLGAGGFGGNRGPKAEPLMPPEGTTPDFSISEKICKNQAALYRLSGDLNPLHIDPQAARVGGFDRPILHGLCTYGFVTRAIVNGPLKGDVSQFKGFKARFSSEVYPGDTLTTEGWKTHGGYIIQARTQRAAVLTNAKVLID